MSIIQKYENILKNLQNRIQNENFDIEQNKDYLEKILEIYQESKFKNFDKVKTLILHLENMYEIGKNSSFLSGSQNISECEGDKAISSMPVCAPCPASAGSFSFMDKIGEKAKKTFSGNKLQEEIQISKMKEEEVLTNEFEAKIINNETRDWKYIDEEDESIESFSSVEMISAIFLQNLKEKIGPLQ